MPITTPVAPTAPTAAPTVPDRGDRVNFPTQVFNAYTYLFGTFWTEFSASAANAYTNATSAYEAATQTALDVISTNEDAAVAAAAALTALNAPGTNATSTSSMTIGTGAKTATIQTGKALVVGMTIVAARTAAPTNRMSGVLTSYDSGTGALAFTSSLTEGSGTYTDWTISLGSITAPVGGISNIVQATTATTLTSAKTLLEITPAAYGVTVTLPDATTCSEGGPLHVIDNKGAFPVRVVDSTGTLLGFINAKTVSHVYLVDNATAAGVWSIENSELAGVSAQLLTTLFRGGITVVALDSNRELIHSNGAVTSLHYAVVYDKSTNTFGAPALVRSASGTASLVLAGTDKVLVASCEDSSAAFEAVVLSISGTAITVGTAATATLSANLSTFADGCALVSVPSVSGSFITSYTVATPAAQIRAISVSGTTVTIGSATVLDGTAGGLIAATGDKVIAVSTATTHLYTKPYTVSGSTLSAGTGTDTNAGTMTLHKLAPLGTRWYVGYNDNATSLNGGVVSLSGTTTTISVATGLCATSSFADAIIIGSNKVLCLGTATTNNANILTDTAGTASAGTAITLDNGTTRRCLYVDGTNAYVSEGTTTDRYFVIDCSGASPISRQIGSSISSSDFSMLTQGSNSVLSRSANAVFGAAYVAALAYQASGRADFIDGRLIQKPFVDFNVGTNYRGSADNQRWSIGTAANGSIIKLECVS